jgi:hypothetical protein
VILLYQISLLAALVGIAFRRLAVGFLFVEVRIVQEVAYKFAWIPVATTEPISSRTIHIFNSVHAEEAYDRERKEERGREGERGMENDWC